MGSILAVFVGGVTVFLACLGATATALVPGEGEGVARDSNVRLRVDVVVVGDVLVVDDDEDDILLIADGGVCAKKKSNLTQHDDKIHHLLSWNFV